MTNKNFSYDEFINNYFEPIQNTIKERQKRYQRYFYIAVILSFVFFAFTISEAPSFIGFKAPYLDAIQNPTLIEQLKKTESSDGVKLAAKLAEWFLRIVAILTVICALIIAVSLPFAVQYLYRRKKVSVDSSNVQYSLKEKIFSDLLDYFGEYTYSTPTIESIGKFNHKSINLNDLSDSKIFPADNDEYISEDHIEGIVDDTKVELSEIKLIKNFNGKRLAVFNGLVIMLDICNVDTKLRGSFSGHTVLISDNAKNLDYVKQKFKDHKFCSLPTKELEDKFELLSTNESEAKKIITEDLLQTIIDLHETVKNANQQITHNDEKALHFITPAIEVYLSFRYFAKYVLYMVFAAPVLGIYNLITTGSAGIPWPWLWDNGNTIEVLDPTKEVDIYNGDISELYAINNTIQLSLFKDKVMITVPYIHDLFEPNSLFEEPLVKEDAEIMFKLMTTIAKVNELVCESKK